MSVSFLAVFGFVEARSETGRLTARPRRDRGEVEACLPKKLRESAPKIVKSLSRVTSCAWAASGRRLYRRLLAERPRVGCPLPETARDHVADD
jgi:hypothetical protein